MSTWHCFCLHLAGVCLVFKFALTLLKLASIFERLQNHYAALDHSFQSNCSSERSLVLCKPFWRRDITHVRDRIDETMGFASLSCQLAIQSSDKRACPNFFFESASWRCTQSKFGDNPQNESWAHHCLLSEIPPEEVSSYITSTLLQVERAFDNRACFR